MRREEVIAAIENFGTRTGTQTQIDEFCKILCNRQTELSMKWNRSWVRKVVLGVMFAPLIIGLVMFRSWGRNPSSLPFQSMPFLIFLLPVWIVVFAWLYNWLKPKFASNEFGMHAKCVKCNYDLSGHESDLGDEIWVGPAMCPECGQDFPAVGE
tara:strand:- start:19868 stop:20329 length:462 start_codon:yes stop_codon:yes gene_type:complete